VERGRTGGRLGAGSEALKAAKLRPLRFHDLRHTFGSIAIDQATIVQVQAWMGHADVQTTMKYMHHRSRAGDARLLSAAFRPKKPGYPSLVFGASGARTQKVDEP
jgi:integrase